MAQWDHARNESLGLNPSEYKEAEEYVGPMLEDIQVRPGDLDRTCSSPSELSSQYIYDRLLHPLPPYL